MGASIRPLEDKPRGKCRKWKITVSLGRDAQGKYRQKSRNFTGTYTEAKAEAMRMKRLADEGKLVARKSYTFQEYANHWNDVRLASGRYSEASIARDRSMLSAVRHLVGQMRLQDVTPDVLESAYARMRAGETLSGKHASGTYTLNIHKRISSMYAYALDHGVVGENPCRKVIPPAVDTPEKKALDLDRLHAVVAALDAADAKQFAAILASQLGLRRGEICGLSRGDIDLEERVVRIRHAYTDVGGLKAPKNKSSVRELPLSDFMAAAARTRIAAMAADFAANGHAELLAEGVAAQPDVAAEAPMICSREGVRMRPSTLSNWWAKARAGFGAEGVKLHELRHTFITAGVLSGVDIGTLQKLSGHANPSVLLGVYTHAAMDAKRNAIEAMSLAS